MKKLLIYVFSGTGNTLKIANLYSREMKDYETTIYQIKRENEDVPNPNDYDLIGFGYPIYGFNPPEVFYRFIKTLPKVENKPSFFFKSSGEPLHLNDGSSQKSYHCLKRKGYRFFTERHYVMPYNMIFRHSDAMAKQMWVYAQGLVKVHSRLIENGLKENVHIPLIKQVHIPIVRIEWPFYHLHGPAFKVDYKKCIKCQKCVNNCPSQNITFENGKFKFHTHCTMCVRCSFNCPKNAISIGWLNGWKVNGDYHLDKLAHDSNISFPALQNESKKMQRVYRKYYQLADKLFAENHIDLSEYMIEKK